MPESRDTTEWRFYWEEMRDGCQKIIRYTQDVNQDGLLGSELLLDAVLRNLELIRESAESLPSDIHPRLPDGEWRKIEDFQEVVSRIHGGEDGHRLWDTIHREVPDLLAAMDEADAESEAIRRDPERRRRGRGAQHIHHIPLRGWRDILWRVYDQMWLNNVFIVAAGVGFYAMLAIFPALALIVSVYGLLFDPADVAYQLNILGGELPPEAWRVMSEQIASLTAKSSTTLSIGAVLGLLLTLWTARAGIGGLILALNIVYGEYEKRSLVRFYFTALLLTLGAILFSVMALGMIVALPAVLGWLGFEERTQALVALLRWPLLAASIIIALAVMYRHGPSRRPAKWEWVSPGAILATGLWMAGSWVFSFYVANFGSYNETYGSVGAVIVLMLWFWLTALAVLLGALFNAEMEHQTKRDTTTGRPKPMGERNAFVADTVGRRP
ncbi:MAG: YhjD/YihY/BrkB family envelope integrity protein [Candidatus Competibacteraceae bacterium]|nr:YhjD/YihY/BrkB family envelope integrity protein [Candidatus Competibacteraceae bacterium]